MKKIRAKHLILGFSAPFVLYAILGGFLGRALARDSAYRYLSVFQDVVTLIMNNYVTPPAMDQVMDGAIRGMMDALDTDSCYLSPDEFRAYRDPDSQPRAGIGVEVTKRYYLQIVGVRPGSPADEAGMVPGDLIKSIDGGNTRELNVIVGESRLRGPAGSEVTLDVIRGRNPEPIEVKINRRDVVDSSVAFEMLEDGAGYISIASFRAGTDVDVKRGIEILKGQGATKLVLDIRNSFGRLAEDGARVAELFIPGGVAARLQSRKGETTDVTLASDRVAFTGPVAVLINRGSSGSAEIVASAFRTADRGELVGVPTSGRAAVQKALSLGDGSGLVLSVGQYWTPDGKPLLGEGLEPTVEVSGGSAEDEEADDPMLQKALEILTAETLKKAA
jgi:carboxyl-terminal processing protease